MSRKKSPRETSVFLTWERVLLVSPKDHYGRLVFFGTPFWMVLVGSQRNQKHHRSHFPGSSRKDTHTHSFPFSRPFLLLCPLLVRSSFWSCSEKPKRRSHAWGRWGGELPDLQCPCLVDCMLLWLKILGCPQRRAARIWCSARGVWWFSGTIE